MRNYAKTTKEIGMRYRFWMGLIGGLMILTGAPFAFGEVPVVAPMLEMTVLGGRQPLREYYMGGRTYIEGPVGQEYTIRLRNHSPGRALCVLSIDGLSAMNGKLAKSTDKGYILPPYATVDVPGWRLSDNQVAQFFFSQLPGSYAAQMDRPTNVGVIGCAVYGEIPPPPVFVAAPQPPGQSERFQRESRARRQDVGTGFGRPTEHRVQHTEFQRATPGPMAVLTIFYKSYEELQEMGLVLAPPPPPVPPVAPNPFPGDYQTPPPPNWHGR
jgi:hypothetical protein